MEHTPEPCIPVSRRDALRTGAALSAALLLTGCAGTARRSTSLPSPLWPDSAPPPRIRDLGAADRAAERAERADAIGAQQPTTPAGPLQVAPRSSWATAGFIPSRMDRQSPIRRITVHHDGMPPVSLRTRADAASRIDQIRRLHQNQGWGDIGYHYVIDPLGSVWEGRPLSWQGAHVANQNPGNIGVMCLGNFEAQSPTPAQLATLDAFLVVLMRQHRVQVRSLLTHQEMAPTACPGRSLQQHMIWTRQRTGRVGSAVA